MAWQENTPEPNQSEKTNASADWLYLDAKELQGGFSIKVLEAQQKKGYASAGDSKSKKAKR